MLPFLLACTPPETLSHASNSPEDTALVDDSAFPVDSGRPVDSAGEDSAPSDSAPSDSNPPDEPPPPIVFDCANLLNPPFEERQMSGARGYHDVAFDDSGHIVGWDGRNSLIRSTYTGEAEAFAPGFSDAQGIEYLPNGDFVVGDDDENVLRRVSPDGASWVLASDFSGIYGIMLGPDGMLYVGAGETISRVDPTTGAREIWLDLDTNGAKARAVAFSPDLSMAYIATVTRGKVFAMPVDASLNPSSEAFEWLRTQRRWHDAIGADACGNIYVAEFYAAALYRISPAGEITALYEGDQNTYGHGFAWGSGIGGWRADAIYLVQPYNDNAVRELVIGVPSSTWVAPE